MAARTSGSRALPHLEMRRTPAAHAYGRCSSNRLLSAARSAGGLGQRYPHQTARGPLPGHVSRDPGAGGGGVELRPGERGNRGAAEAALLPWPGGWTPLPRGGSRALSQELVNRPRTKEPLIRRAAAAGWRRRDPALPRSAAEFTAHSLPRAGRGPGHGAGPAGAISLRMALRSPRPGAALHLIPAWFPLARAPAAPGLSRPLQLARLPEACC